MPVNRSSPKTDPCISCGKPLPRIYPSQFSGTLISALECSTCFPEISGDLQEKLRP